MEEEGNKFRLWLIPDIRIEVKVKPSMSHTYYTVCWDLCCILSDALLLQLLDNLYDFLLLRSAERKARHKRLKEMPAPEAILASDLKLMKASIVRVRRLDQIIKQIRARNSSPKGKDNETDELLRQRETPDPAKPSAS